MNPMREIRIEKVTLNMGCGEDKLKLERSRKFLEQTTEQKSIITKTHKRTSFGMVKSKKIGVKITLRKQEAVEFLKDTLQAADNKIKASQINGGNFSIGIKENIDLPKFKYDPDIGILGLDVCVTLERPGFRVKRRLLKKVKIGKKHLISKKETIDFLKNNLGADVVE